MGVQRQQEKCKELLCDKKTHEAVTSVNMRNMGCGLEVVLRNNNGP